MEIMCITNTESVSDLYVIGEIADARMICVWQIPFAAR